MAVRIIEESENGLGAAFDIITALVYLVLVVPILFVVDLIRGRRHSGRHRA